MTCPFFSKAPKCTCGAYTYIDDTGDEPVRACPKCATRSPVEPQALARFMKLKAARQAQEKIAAVARGVVEHARLKRWCAIQRIPVGEWLDLDFPTPADDVAINACIRYHAYRVADEEFVILAGLADEPALRGEE